MSLTVRRSLTALCGGQAASRAAAIYRVALVIHRVSDAIPAAELVIHGVSDASHTAELAIHGVSDAIFAGRAAEQQAQWL